MSEIYSFSVETADGKQVSLDAYQGKVMLIVNVASKCGFTRQYDALEALYRRFRDEGLVILGFPCNQFGSQEPGSNEEIQQFCRLNYGVTFPVFAKIEVNGAQAHPLYAYLKAQARGIGGTTSIKWNFTKFLVGRDGTVMKRYSPATPPDELAEPIAEALSQGSR